MTQQETSHIEIIKDDDEEKQIIQEKNSVWKKMTDISGWKKDLKKIVYVFGILAVIIGGFVFGKKMLDNSFGIHFQSPVQFVSYQKYFHTNPDFGFSYPKGYVFDGDENKKYGGGYLAGFYLDSDQRTGCDIRISEVGINFSKTDQEINDAISKDLSDNVRGFSNYRGKRIKIDGKDAMQIDFSLTDPLSNTLHITQIMVSNGNENYLIACGSGQAQYKFFQKDFQDFISSFRWKK